ncbi:hypothetical protein Tco_0802899 [Tanacetum coccineum]|uniref:Uncharacterized protein n=1 Tax=Tanacetum coccineum TaxID=301880 RepID=A0ABQ5A2W3_9ASTR
MKYLESILLVIMKLLMKKLDDFVINIKLEPAYLEFMPPEDDVFLTKEQPLPTAVSPTAELLGYITESDPGEDPKEKDDEDPEEDPTDYPMDIYDDDEEEEFSGDDVDDEEEDESNDEEEEEHLALADSVPPLAYRTTAKMEIGYGITDVWEDPDEISKEIPATDVAELGQRYGPGFWSLLAQVLLVEAWVQSMDASDTTRSEVRALRTTVLAQQIEIEIYGLQNRLDDRHSLVVGT